MNSITKFAVKYPVSVLMLTLAVCLLGTISYNKLGTDLFPDLKNPALYVEVKSGQRPPEEVEKLITTNIESTTARQEGVKSVYSITKVGYTKVTVEYGWDQDMDAAFLDLQRSVSSLSQDETIEEVNVTRYDANATPIMTIALTHNEVKDMNELRKIAENYMRNELVRVDGIADIQMNGQEVFRFAVKKVPECIRQVTEKTETQIETIDWFILHQANSRIIQSVAKRLGVPEEKFPMNMEQYGNTSAASIPILLDEMNKKGMLQPGQKIILSGFGAGLTWGAAQIEW